MKTKEIECFKVVRYLHPVFKSFCIRSKDTLDLTYELNKTTYPKIGKIFVFDSLKSAEFFIECNYSFIHTYYILKGIGTNPVKIKRINITNYTMYEEDFIEVLWKLKKNHKSVSILSTRTRTPPLGTLCVDSFKPLERIK